MAYYLSALLFAVVFVSIYSFYFKCFTEPREMNRIRRVFITVVWCALVFAGPMFPARFMYLRVITLMLVTIVSTCILFDVSPIRSALMNLLLYSLMSIFEVIIAFIAEGFLGRNFFEEGNSLLSLLLGCLSQLFGIIFVYLMKSAWGSKDMKELSVRDLPGFIALPLFSLVICVTVVFNFSSGLSRPQYMTVLFMLVGLMVVNLLTFDMLRRTHERESQLREIQIMTERADSTARLYKAKSDNYEQLRARNHEFKSRIAAIGLLAKNGEYDRLLKMVEDVEADYRKDRIIHDTGNIIVDNIIDMKYEEIQKYGIDFQPKLGDLKELAIKDDDLVIILSNLLDNAIEACRKCEGDREISLKFTIEDGNIILAVSNTYDGHSIRKNGAYVSTKTASGDHGIGIKNIVRIIGKYHGDYTIEEKDGRFSFYILIENGEMRSWG